LFLVVYLKKKKKKINKTGRKKESGWGNWGVAFSRGKVNTLPL
jgi:hypothetical protein